MKRPLITAISALLLTLSVTGCAQTGSEIDYSQLNTNETKLLSIQDEVNAQIENLNTELQKNPPDYDQIRFLATETAKIIDQSITQVENLAEELGNSKIVTDTKKVLTSAQMLVSKVKELAADLQVLQRDVAQLTDDAKKEIETKIAETNKLLEGYKTRLKDIKNRFQELRDLVFGTGSKTSPQTPAEAASASKQSQSTI